MKLHIFDIYTPKGMPVLYIGKVVILAHDYLAALYKLGEAMPGVQPSVDYADLSYSAQELGELYPHLESIPPLLEEFVKRNKNLLARIAKNKMQ